MLIIIIITGNKIIYFPKSIWFAITKSPALRGLSNRSSPIAVSTSSIIFPAAAKPYTRKRVAIMTDHTTHQPQLAHTQHTLERWLISHITSTNARTHTRSANRSLMDCWCVTGHRTRTRALEAVRIALKMFGALERICPVRISAAPVHDAWSPGTATASRSHQIRDTGPYMLLTSRRHDTRPVINACPYAKPAEPERRCSHRRPARALLALSPIY